MFMSMGRDYVSELLPPTGLLFIPHISVSQTVVLNVSPVNPLRPSGNYMNHLL
jgi:hypothetical protein